MGNDTFPTEDITLASYLRAKGIKLLAIEQGTGKRNLFVFEKPPDSYLAEWLRGNATADARALIAEYRHLKRGDALPGATGQGGQG